MASKQPRKSKSGMYFSAFAAVVCVLLIMAVTTIPGKRRWKQMSFAALRKLRLGSKAPKASPIPVVEDKYIPHPKPPLVPGLVHFVFGLQEDFGHIKFGLIHYLAILGAHMYIQPEEIRWHHKYEPGPENVYWQCGKPFLNLVKVEDVTEVWGKPMKMRVQHRADILRMQIMLHQGGMYLDSDFVALRSFDDIRRSDLTMGIELGEGLCNAVMVGIPNSTFINRWWDRYREFNPDAWSYHSVQLPRILQRQNPSEVQVLSEKAFFTPSWMDLTAMYDADDGYTYQDNYGVHLWTSADPNKRAHLAALTIADVFKGKGNFHRAMRKLLREAWRGGFMCSDLAYQVGNLTSTVPDPEPIPPKKVKEEKGV